MQAVSSISFCKTSAQSAHPPSSSTSLCVPYAFHLITSLEMLYRRSAVAIHLDTHAGWVYTPLLDRISAWSKNLRHSCKAAVIRSRSCVTPHTHNVMTPDTSRCKSVLRYEIGSDAPSGSDDPRRFLASHAAIFNLKTKRRLLEPQFHRVYATNATTMTASAYHHHSINLSLLISLFASGPRQRQ